MPGTTNWSDYRISVDTIETQGEPAGDDSFVFAGDGSVMPCHA